MYFLLSNHTTASPHNTQQQLQQLALQYLLHNFLYSQLQQPLISDADYDRIAQKLWQLHQQHPDIPLPHQKLLQSALGPEASSFVIRNYPPHIITIALKLLYAYSKQRNDFREFVERKGYCIIHAFS